METTRWMGEPFKRPTGWLLVMTMMYLSSWLSVRDCHTVETCRKVLKYRDAA